MQFNIMSLIWNREETFYAYPDWSTWWENPNKSKKRNSDLTNSIFNRNSLHVDTTWETSKNKGLIQRILDWIKWIKDDDSKTKHFKNEAEIEKAISRFLNNTWLINTCREENVEILISNLKNALEKVDATTHFDLFSEAWVRIAKNQTNPYSEFNYWITWFNFVKLEDKNSYIKTVSKGALNSINIYWNKLKSSEPLDLYIKLWYILWSEVREKLRILLNTTWMNIYMKLSEWYQSSKRWKTITLPSFVKDIPEYQKYILAHCFKTWIITKSVATSLNFDKVEDFDYYVSNYWQIDLIDIYYKKLIWELTKELEEKYFRV